MGLNTKEIQEKYLWLTKGGDECITLEKKDYDAFMSEDMDLFILEQATCNMQRIIDSDNDILQNARRIIISFVTSNECSFFNITQNMEKLTENVDENCEILFTSHPDKEAMSNNVCSFTLLVKYKK